MTTLVTADKKGRLPIRGSSPGQRYLVTQIGGEWRVTAWTDENVPSRNRREWSGAKGQKGLFSRLKTMAEAGLRLEKSEAAQKPVPPCRF